MYKINLSIVSFFTGLGFIDLSVYNSIKRMLSHKEHRTMKRKLKKGG